MYLGIDNCTNLASVCLYDNAVLYEETWPAQMNHTVTTLPKIEKALFDLGKNFSQLKGIACAKGPGSFNGTRAGMSLSLGLGMSLEIPVVFVSSMEISAMPFMNCGYPIMCLMNAGRDEVYAATFEKENVQLRTTTGEHISTLDKVLSKIIIPTLFCGEYTNDARDYISERLGDLAIVPSVDENRRSAFFLIKTALPKLVSGDNETPEPLYLRKPPINISSKIKVSNFKNNDDKGI